MSDGNEIEKDKSIKEMKPRIRSNCIFVYFCIQRNDIINFFDGFRIIKYIQLYQFIELNYKCSKNQKIEKKNTHICKVKKRK